MRGWTPPGPRTLHLRVTRTQPVEELPTFEQVCAVIHRHINLERAGQRR